MNKLLFGLLTLAGTAFAALTPAGADVIETRAVTENTFPSSVRLAWRPDATATCRVEMRWKRDYSGALYLKKVRVCA